MATSVESITAQLKEHQQRVDEAQQAVIDALESRAARTDDMAALEEAVAEAVRQRDDIAGTRQFLISRALVTGGGTGEGYQTASVDPDVAASLAAAAPGLPADNAAEYTSTMYMSQWAPGLTMDGIQSRLPGWVLDNEANGITGVLYVLAEWFVSYVEGPARSMARLLRRLGKDKRHRLMRVIQRKTLASPQDRLCTNGLEVRWHTEGPTHGTAPWLSVVEQLQSRLALTNFVPKALPAVNLSNEERRQIVVAVTPSEEFWEKMDTQPPLTQLETLRAARDAVRDAVDPIAGAALITPHDETLYAVFLQSTPEAVLSLVTQLRDTLMQAVPGYYHQTAVVRVPMADAAAVNDGVATIVGPAVRRLRQLTTVGRQKDVPVVLSKPFRDALSDPIGDAVAIGFFELDRMVEEVFAPRSVHIDKTTATWAAFKQHQISRAAAAPAARSSTADSALRHVTVAGQPLTAAAEALLDDDLPDRAAAVVRTMPAVPAATAVASTPPRLAPDSGVLARVRSLPPDDARVSEAAFRVQVPGGRDDALSVFQLLEPAPDNTVTVRDARIAILSTGNCGVPALKAGVVDEAFRKAAEEGVEPGRVTEDQFLTVWAQFNT